MLLRAYLHIYFKSINAIKTMMQLTFLLSEWATRITAGESKYSKLTEVPPAHEPEVLVHHWNRAAGANYCLIHTANQSFGFMIVKALAINTDGKHYILQWGYLRMRNLPSDQVVSLKKKRYLESSRASSTAVFFFTENRHMGFCWQCEVGIFESNSIRVLSLKSINKVQAGHWLG